MKAEMDGYAGQIRDKEREIEQYQTQLSGMQEKLRIGQTGCDRNFEETGSDEMGWVNE